MVSPFFFAGKGRVMVFTQKQGYSLCCPSPVFCIRFASFQQINFRNSCVTKSVTHEFANEGSPDMLKSEQPFLS